MSHAWLDHLALVIIVCPQATKAGELLRPSLPSVLRTSADLGAGLTKTPAATGDYERQALMKLNAAVMVHVMGLPHYNCSGSAASGSPAAAGKTEAEHGRRLPGRLAPGELLGTLGLPRCVDILSECIQPSSSEKHCT